MALFPTTWELLLPSFNITTIIGALLILGGIASIIWLVPLLGVSALKSGIGSIIVGVILIWGVSIAIKFFKSTGGQVIFWGAVAIAIIAVLLFWEPKVQKGSGKIEW